MIKGISIILLFYLLGNAISHLIGGYIPGSVCGMLLLFAALCARWVKPESVRGVSLALTQNMAVLFVPAGVGIMAYYGLIAQHWVAIVTITVVCTLLVLISVGAIAQYLDKNFNNKKSTSDK